MFNEDDRAWLRRKIRHLERGFRAAEQRDTRIMALIDDLSAKFDAVGTGVDSIQTSLTGIRGDITTIKNSLPASGGLSAADVATLSGKLDALASKVTAVQTDANELDTENPVSPAA